MRSGFETTAMMQRAGEGDLSALRLAARNGSADAAKEAAVQFEALFIQMVLGEMRRSQSFGGGLFDSAQSDLYHQMFDQRIAEQMSRAGGIGLADSLHRHLGIPPGAAIAGGEVGSRSGGPEGERELAMPVRRGGVRAVDATTRIDPEQQARLAAAIATGVVPLAVDGDDDEAIEALHEVEVGGEGEAAGGVDWPPATPEAFVDALMPHARRAGARLGVAPEVLVAQAALETGWGQHMMPGRNGQPSFNLFGVKTGSEWQGARVSVPTLEYRDGVARRERAEFRVYDGLAESFDDYAALLERLPRYRPALERAAEPRGFLDGLQQGGYATDPRYADKIMGIVERGLPGHRDAGGRHDVLTAGQRSATPERG